MNTITTPMSRLDILKQTKEQEFVSKIFETYKDNYHSRQQNLMMQNKRTMRGIIF